MHIGLQGQFASWAGTLIGIGPSLVLVAEDAKSAEESIVRLARVGIEKVEGYLDGGVLAWQQDGRPLAEVPQISALQLYEQLCDQPDLVQVIDVRRPMEWETGHLERAVLKPLHQLRDCHPDLDGSKPIAAHCKSGYRSSIATSILKAAGFQQVMNVVGGLDAWQAHGLPIVKDACKAATHPG